MKFKNPGAHWLRRISAKLTSLFVLFVIVPAILLSIVTYQVGSAALEKAATDKLESAIALKERSISSWFVEERNFVRVLAQDTLVRDYGVKLLALNGSDPTFNAIYAALLAHLQSVVTSMPGLLRISILSDVGGREILSTDPTQVGRYHLTDSFFTSGREATYIQRVYYSERVKAPIMIIATPLTNREGHVAGVLYVALNPSFLNEMMLDRSGLGETGETYVVDTRRKLVTDVRGALPSGAGEIHTFGVEAALERTRGNATYDNYEGRRVIGFFRWLDEPKLGLIAEVNLDEALAPIIRLRQWILVAIASIALVGFIVAWLVAREISRPVIAVAAAASRVARGDLNQQAPVFTRDEIGELSKSFNTMTDALRRAAVEKDRVLDDLQRSNSELLAATAAKNIFLANMSHELRTPLNAIIGYSELLQEQAAAEHQTAIVPDLDKIHAAGQHLLSLINDILDLTRIEAGKVDLAYESFSIQEFVRSVAQIATPLMKPHGNDFQIVCPDDIGNMISDSTRLRQVLLNLLGNAAKFTEHGTITLTVERRANDRTNSMCFRVRDTGIGIATEQLARIFQEFVQGDLSATKRFGGAGLGLAITKRLCELLGGRINVTSAPGQGSEFVVEVPVNAATSTHELLVNLSA